MISRLKGVMKLGTPQLIKIRREPYSGGGGSGVSFILVPRLLGPIEESFSPPTGGPRMGLFLQISLFSVRSSFVIE